MKPTGVGTAPDHSICTYKWIDGVYGTPTPTCSSTATRIRTVACQRQDPQLTEVEASHCDATSPDAKTTDGPLAYYAGCSYAVGAWSGTPSSTCSDTATRHDTAVSCVRSGGNVPTTATVAECQEAGVAVARDVGPYSELSGCTYTPTIGAYGACIASTPGGTDGIQTAAVTSCTRSDGKAVQTSSCRAQTKACTIAYTATAWDTNAVCVRTTPGQSAGTQTQPATNCRQSSDNALVNNSYCAAKVVSCTPDSYSCGAYTQYAVVTAGAFSRIQKSVTAATIPLRQAAAIALCQKAAFPTGYPYLRSCGFYDRGGTADVYMDFVKTATDTTYKLGTTTDPAMFWNTCTNVQ